MMLLGFCVSNTSRQSDMLLTAFAASLVLCESLLDDAAAALGVTCPCVVMFVSNSAFVGESNLGRLIYEFCSAIDGST